MASEGETRPRAGSWMPTRVVLMAVDLSEHAKTAFNWFLVNIHRPDDLIVLINIPEAPKLPSFSFKSGIAPPVEEWKKTLDDMNSKTRQIEEEFEGTAIAKKLHYKMRFESYKNPGEGICRVADEEHADLICMGTRGLSAVKRAFIGSCSEYVTRHSNLPTVIIPNK